MVRIRELTQAAAARADDAATAAAQQQTAMDRLADTSQRTAGTAVDLDALAARFRVSSAET
jgi:hypothetical protein